MKSLNAMRRFAVASALMLGAATVANAGPIHMDLSPSVQVVNVGDTVEIDLIVMTSDGSPQGFDALDAILGWDTGFLSLTGFDNSGAGASFFLTGFLPDGDNINDDVTDGDAMFNALATPGSPVSAPASPGSLIITTFQFQALAETAGTNVVLIPSIGTFSSTRVLLNGVEVTGNVLGPATIVIVPSPGALAFLGAAGLIGRRRRRRN